MHMMKRAGLLAVLIAVAFAAFSTSPLAQRPGRERPWVDLQGMWNHAALMVEDRPIIINATGGAAQPGDYTGVPLNDAGRQWTDAWTGDRLAVPEHQCMPHPSQYSLWGPGDWRITDIVDPDTQETLGFELYGTFERATRQIWIDGRPHPPSWARHTWAGFSTGVWEGNMLNVSTTHLKEGWIQRNGITVSDQATMSEHYIKHDNYLTAVFIVNDPEHLEEPFIRTTAAVLDPTVHLGPTDCTPFNINTMLVGHPRGYVPHLLPGDNDQLAHFAETHGIPPEAARGGAKTTYPEYVTELRKMIADQKISAKSAKSQQQ